MANLIDLLQSQLTDGMIDQLSKQIGAPQQQTRTAADSILSTIIGGLAKNTSNPSGADIYLDNIPTHRTTPAIFKDVAAGKHFIKMVKKLTKYRIITVWCRC